MPGQGPTTRHLGVTDLCGPRSLYPESDQNQISGNYVMLGFVNGDHFVNLRFHEQSINIRSQPLVAHHVAFVPENHFLTDLPVQHCQQLSHQLRDPDSSDQYQFHAHQTNFKASLKYYDETRIVPAKEKNVRTLA